MCYGAASKVESVAVLCYILYTCCVMYMTEHLVDDYQRKLLIQSYLVYDKLVQLAVLNTKLMQVAHARLII